MVSLTRLPLVWAQTALGSIEDLRAGIRLKPLWTWLHPNSRVLDIGCGSGAISRILQASQDVIPLDVKDWSLYPGIRPLLFDGKSIPLADQSVETALFITVLHHTSKPLTLLLEARRVARYVIIVEDVISSSWNRRWTFWVDNLLNLEFRHHPHANASHDDWRRIFRGLGFQLKAFQFHRTILGVQLGYYFLRSSR